MQRCRFAPASRRSLSVQPVFCASRPIPALDRDRLVRLWVLWSSGPVEGDVFMRVPRLATIAISGLGLAAAMASTTPPTSGPVRSPVSVSSVSASGRALADVTVRPGVQHAGRVQASPPTTADCEKAYKVACYEPAQIQRAYDLPSLYASGVTGRGTTIVIVDSFGSPTIRHDLTVFDTTFRLPAPPKFTIIRPAGAVPRYDRNNSDMVGWAGETTLDVEYAHVIAPGAN